MSEQLTKVDAVMADEDEAPPTPTGLARLRLWFTPEVFLACAALAIALLAFTHR